MRWLLNQLRCNRYDAAGAGQYTDGDVEDADDAYDDDRGDDLPPPLATSSAERAQRAWHVRS